MPNFGGPHNKDYNNLGSILGSPYFGKLPGCFAWNLASTRRSPMLSLVTSKGGGGGAPEGIPS